MQTDPAHPVRIKVEQALADLANDLQTKPETAGQGRGDGSGNCSTTSRSGCGSTPCGRRAREAIIRAARNPDAAMAGKLGDVLKSMGQSLEKDERIRTAINQFARRAVAGMAASYGGSIVKLVSETVRGWDAQTITDRLESGGRPRPAIYPHQRHLGRRSRRPAAPRARHALNRGFEMKKLVIALALATAAPAFAQAPAPVATPVAEAVTVIHAGTLLAEPGKPARRNATIIVRGRTIAEVRDGFVDMPGARVVDLRTATVLPGLIDSHVHLVRARRPAAGAAPGVGA